MRGIKSSWKQRLIAGLLIQSLLWLAACGTDGAGNAVSGSSQAGIVTGKVVSAADASSVAGATVSTSAGVTTTGSDGSFTVQAPVGDRSLLHVEAPGFAEAFPVARVLAGETTTIGVKLLATGVSTIVTVATGGTVSVPNSTAQVQLPADGLVPKNGGAVAGTVNVSVTPINPAVDPNLMPGDYTGVSAGGTTAIESFGAIVVDIRDNAGVKYNLAAEKTATIRIPLGTQNPNPPTTVPLWYFDETSGLWKEEGTATLQGSAPDQYYEGVVMHFSTWNADQPAFRTWVLGCVRDTNGQAVANAIVQATGVDYTGSDTRFTATDGTFKVGLRKGGTATISVSRWNLSPFSYEKISNIVTITSSASDPTDFERTLPNCLVVNPGVLTITTSILAGGNVGAAYNQSLVATGGVPGYVWDLNAAPDLAALSSLGLTLNSSGTIVGTPTAAGTITITVKVTDYVNGTATKQFTFAISPAGVTPIRITTTTPLPAGTVGSIYNFIFSATGGTGAKTWSVVSGVLPNGLTLNPSTGSLSGTPTASGTSTVTIQVRDSSNPTQLDQKQFSLTVNSNSGGGGGGSGQLSVSSAPASVGGTFVVNPSLTYAYTYQIFNPQVSATAIVWQEGDLNTNWSHWEAVGIGYSTSTGQLDATSVVFYSWDLGASSTPTYSTWTCTDYVSFCGVTVNITTRTVTFNNSVLTDSLSNVPAITLNGTLTYPDPSTIFQ